MARAVDGGARCSKEVGARERPGETGDEGGLIAGGAPAAGDLQTPARLRSPASIASSRAASVRFASGRAETGPGGSAAKR